MKEHAEGVAHAIKAGENVQTLSQETYSPEESGLILDVAAQFQPDLLVIDLPYADLDTSYFEILKEKGVKVFFLDDFRFFNPGADIFLNSSILARSKTVMPEGSDAQYLMGPDYFIFDENQLNAGPIKTSGLFNVVLSFGGSDPTCLTLKVMKALGAEPWTGVLFRVILGPGYGDIETVTSLSKVPTPLFEVIDNPPDILPFFLGCDLAVCAGGRTMYELLYLDKLFLPIATTKYEGEAIAEFENQDLVEFGMRFWDTKHFITTMKQLIP